MYKKNADKESNDYEMLCSAEKLESAITSPDSKISSSDLATLCRLTKIRSQDEEVLLHLIRSLTHVVSRRGVLILLHSDSFNKAFISFKNLIFAKRDPIKKERNL